MSSSGSLEFFIVFYCILDFLYSQVADGCVRKHISNAFGISKQNYIFIPARPILLTALPTGVRRPGFCVRDALSGLLLEYLFPNNDPIVKVRLGEWRLVLFSLQLSKHFSTTYGQLFPLMLQDVLQPYLSLISRGNVFSSSLYVLRHAAEKKNKIKRSIRGVGNLERVYISALSWGRHFLFKKSGRQHF